MTCSQRPGTNSQDCWKWCDTVCNIIDIEKSCLFSSVKVDCSKHWEEASTHLAFVCCSFLPPAGPSSAKWSEASGVLGSDRQAQRHWSPAFAPKPHPKICWEQSLLPEERRTHVDIDSFPLTGLKKLPVPSSRRQSPKVCRGTHQNLVISWWCAREKIKTNEQTLKVIPFCQRSDGMFTGAMWVVSDLGLLFCFGFVISNFWH